jgi:Zn-dependent M28 family amino/carboxypeptidase
VRGFALAIGIGVLLTAGAGGAAVGHKAGPAARSPASTQALARAITPGHLKAHLEALQAVAKRNGGTRAAGTPGYSESAAYVVRQLRAAGLRPRQKTFSFDYFRETRPTVFERVSPGLVRYQRNRDFLTMRYSGGGNLTAPVVPVEPSSASSGCEDSDFSGFPSGGIALLRRGGCPFSQKAGTAQASGAVAALIENDGLPGRTAPLSATLFGSGTRIPVLVISSDVGSELTRLAQAGVVRVHLDLSVATTKARAANVIADLPGRQSGVMLLGAHLDSVANGPGINDNGSGTAAVLEIARQARRLHVRPQHGLRFAFWGAEELGLVGSRSYAQSLGLRERRRILGVINLDMVGSPNFDWIVYDGDDGPSGSRRIENAFRAYFASRRMPVEQESLDGSSDHASFAELGIPVGGLFTGADALKSPASARRSGGSANLPFDACYHKVCDTPANVNVRMLAQMADAAAVIAVRLAS